MIGVTKEESVAWVQVKHPPANALSTELLTQLDERMTELSHDDEISAIILHGERRFFVAGADIKEFEGKKGSDLADGGQALFNKLESFNKPIVAAIHGAALGGGLELAMACTIRIATEDAKLGLPETNLGLIPGYGGTQRLPKLVGPHKAAEMMLTGLPITGADALMWRLVNDTAKDEQQLLEKAGKLAQTIAEKSRLTSERILDLVQEAHHGEDFEKGLKKEAQYFSEVFDSADAKEGIGAFLEKRKPEFSNR
ncbi:enoyl-CoA hydratase [Geomicrobium sp. JCM 19037]|uniref:enoyl-CoA hydratase n=1 Tax=Geomicrobium sp. JCM 19037 TaxID=1460634 RepID=UPI00045F42B7|nr:enoyl-CoA hydratase [Geomicrobium sp. JCM 19037]GAK05172.1 enoyl-CoA hydratase [Geomicrobium sp. JCM 19037]